MHLKGKMEPSPCLQPLYNAQSTAPFTPTGQTDIQNSGAYFGDNGYSQSTPQQNYQHYAMTTMSPVASPSITTPSQAPVQDYGPMFGAHVSEAVQYSPNSGSDSQSLNNGFTRMMPPNRFVDSQQQPLHTLRLPPHSNTNFNYGNTQQQQNTQQYGILQESGTNNKRTFLGEITEPDSSNNTRESAHINRKKRKACGRCGPCQRKDNCGTCMNCVNRAKGKQICIFRKCEELKKKPTSDGFPANEIRSEKRKDLDSLHTTSDKKRLKGKDSLNSSQTLPPQYPGYQSKSYPSRNPQAYPSFETVPANSLLGDSFHNTLPSSNLHWQGNVSPAIPQTDFSNLSPQSGGYIQQDQTNLPDQLLTNLRRYNAPTSFQRNPVNQKNPENAFNPTPEQSKVSEPSPLTHQYSKQKEQFPVFPETNSQTLSLLNELDNTYNDMLPHTVANDSLLFRYPQPHSTSTDMNTIGTSNALYEPSGYVPPNSMSFTDQKWVQQPVQQHVTPTSETTNLHKTSGNMPQHKNQFGNGLLNNLQSPISSLVPGSPPLLPHESHMSPCISNMPQLAPSPNTVPQENEIFTGEHFLDKTGSSAKVDDLLSSQSNLALTASLSNTTSDQSKSPNKDTNSISPGESGYDSAEMSLPSDEYLPNHFQSSQRNNIDNNFSSVPKNLHPASVEQPSQTVSDTSETLVNATGAVTSNQGHTPTHSSDEKSVFEFSPEIKTPVRLRRYSNPNATFSTQEQPQVSSADPLNVKEEQQPPTSASITTSTDIKVDVDQKPKPKLAYGSLDTPPMTPNSMSNYRKYSTEYVTTAPTPHHPLPSVMQTPPYSADIWTGKKTEQQFFGCQPPPPQQQEMREPTFNEMRGLPKTITTETAGKKQQKTVYVYPTCNCIPGASPADEEPPYYTHLGAACDVPGLRALFEKRTGFTGKQLRIEKVIYTGKEGKTSRGCPIAKWILRRGNETEKILVVCRYRPGHHCPTSYIAVVVVLWEGVAAPLADYAYDNYAQIIPNNTEPTERKCGANETKTCACQGFNDENGGASFSFGCSWSMYYNGCKFARSVQPKKFKLTSCKEDELEKFIEVLSSKLATVVSPVYKMATPHAHANQIEFQKDGLECRLGDNDLETGRPFCGFTTCFDFCAHAHKDSHNMDNGSTVVVTLTKPELRGVGRRPADEQLHVLPLYKLDLSNEDGTFDGVSQKIVDGSVEILSGFRREVRMRDEPYLNKKQRQRLARKKRTSTFEDINSPRKRRGRPPKRSLSVEDLTQIAEAEPKPLMGFPPNIQRTAGLGHLQMHPGMMNHHAIPTPFNQQTPPRWPYRRPSDGLMQQPSFSPVNTPLLYSPVSTVTPKTGNEHLPSIGSFLSHKNNETTPSTSTLPSLDTVMSHPFRKNFSVVNPQTPQSQQSVESSPDVTATKISLKSYAVGSSANSMTQSTFNQTVKSEPCPSQSFPHNIQPHMRNVPHQSNAARHGQNVAPQIPNNETNPAHMNSNLNIPLMNMSGHAAPTYLPTMKGHIQPNRIPPMNRQDHARPTYISPMNGPGHATPTNNPPMGMGHLMQGLPMNRHPYNPPKPPPVKTEVYSDSEDNFIDSSIGGVAIAPTHGSVIIECAKRELHATTPLLRPNRFRPSRISLVFYQHKSMNLRNHGAAQYEAREEKRQQLKDEKREREELEKRLAAEKEQENLQAAMKQNHSMQLPTLADMFHSPQHKMMYHQSSMPYQQYRFPTLPRQHPFMHDHLVGHQQSHASMNRQTHTQNEQQRQVHQPGKQALSSYLHQQMLRQQQSVMHMHEKSSNHESKPHHLRQTMSSADATSHTNQSFPQHQIPTMEQNRMRDEMLNSPHQSPLPQQHMKSPLPQQHMKSPLPQQHMKSPLPQQHMKSSLPQQHMKSPLPQQHMKSPLPQQQMKSPLPQQSMKSMFPQEQIIMSQLSQQQMMSQRSMKSPFQQRHIQSPLPQQQMKSPLSQQQMKSPLSQQQMKSPLPQQQINSPLPQQQINSPLSQHQMQSPLPQQQMKSPLSQQQMKSPLPQQHMKSPLPQQQLKSPLPQQQKSPFPQQHMAASFPQQQTSHPMPQVQVGSKQHMNSLLSHHQMNAMSPQQLGKFQQQRIMSPFPQQPQSSVKSPMHHVASSMSQQHAKPQQPSWPDMTSVQQLPAHNYLQQSMLHNNLMQQTKQRMIYNMPPAYQPHSASYNTHYHPNNGQYFQKPNPAMQSMNQVSMNPNVPSINHEVNPQQMNSQKYFPT